MKIRQGGSGMGLIKAITGAIGGTMADQWKEFFYCDSLPGDVLVRKGQKRTSGRSANTRGNDNIISNGSGIAVANGQCMIIVEQGKIVELCAEPGEFTYDRSGEPSLFSGDLGESILQTFEVLGKRFSFGGDTGKDQRVYYFNMKEIMDNKFGTPNPIMFDVVNLQIGMQRTVQIRCNGVFSYRITDPILFYTQVCGNIEYEFTRDEIDAQLKTEFIDGLQPAFAVLSEMALRPSQIPAHTTELKDAVNRALETTWTQKRGLQVQSIALNPITLTPEDIEKINQLEDAATVGSNPFIMAGRMTEATANSMETAAGNSAGAMHGYVGMGMSMNQGASAGFGAAQNLYFTGMKNRAQMMREQEAQEKAARRAQEEQEKAAKRAQQSDSSDSWQCRCGAVVSGKFCSECGSPRPEKWTCTCGAVNTGNFCSNCGAKKP